MAYAIGVKIKKYREARRVSQKELAKRIGVSTARVSNWEAGINRPDVDMLAAICRALEISPSELLDVHLDIDELTEHEKLLIKNYRLKSDLQKAVDILLGIEGNSY